jgi:hypothetical protein
MHKEILTEEQGELLPLLKKFSRTFGMVGGTAIALYIRHRRSIDFDLFSLREFDTYLIRKKISKLHTIERIVTDRTGQYTVLIKGVRFTFFHYPYGITFSKNFDDYIKIPSLLTLAAMKAHALGQRAKWKDYVDLYFIIKNYYSIDMIVKKAKSIFGNEFNEKLLRTQLAYFDDVDYREEVEYLKGFETSDSVIKRELTKFSIQ